MNRLTCSLLKPNKRTPFYRLRYRTAGEYRWRSKSLGVRNKDVAEKMRIEFIEEYEKEAGGISPPRIQVIAAKTDLRVLVDEYISDLQARQVSAKYSSNERHQILIPAEHCGWRTIADVNSADFLRWRPLGSERGPRTLNMYLASLDTFFTWLRRSGRTNADPFAGVTEVNEKRDIRRKRRALTDGEVKRLLLAAPEWRRIVYFLVLWTGLRRNEVKNLTWGDVILDADCPRIVLRGETTKNGKVDSIVIHPELEIELRRLWGEGQKASARVVRMFSRMDPIKADLARAGIEFKNEWGRADFHALRHTFNMRMQVNGVSLVFAQRAMRHSDSKLTTDVYFDPTIAARSNALAQVPGLLEDGQVSHIVSHSSGSKGLSASQADTNGHKGPSTELIENQGICPELAQTGASGHKLEKSSSGWDRTNDLVVNSHPLYR